MEQGSDLRVDEHSSFPELSVHYIKQVLEWNIQKSSVCGWGLWVVLRGLTDILALQFPFQILRL